MSVLMLVPQFGDCSFVLSLETVKCESSILFFFLKFVLAILDPLHFHMNLRMSLVISAVKPSWNLDRHYIESIDRFGTFAILTILSLLVYEHFLISLSDGVYRETIDICMLIFY